MEYRIRRVAPQPTPEEQARIFWDVIQKLSLLLGLALTIRSLSK
jgi:hypothetical protein